MTRKHPIDRRLAKARPDDLDVTVDPTRRQRDLDAAFAAPAVVRRSRRPMAVAVAGAASLAAVVAIAVPYALPDSGVRREAQEPPRSAPTTVRAMSARQALLGAAAAAGQLPAATGSYWRVRSEYFSVHGVLEAPYLVKLRMRQDNWTAYEPNESSWWIHQSLGARPVIHSPGNTRTSWTELHWVKCVNKKTKSVDRCPMKLTLPARSAKPVASRSNVGAKVFDLAGRNVSVADLQRLPGDPRRLMAWLLSRYEGHSTEADSDPMSETEWLFSVISGMVTDMPVKPAVRAAAFRILADLPGFRVLNGVRDVLGRTGTAVAIDIRTPDGGVYEDRLIFDLGTSAALAREQIVVKAGTNGHPPGTRTSTQVVESAGWTDERPVLPKR